VGSWKLIAIPKLNKGTLLTQTPVEVREMSVGSMGLLVVDMLPPRRWARTVIVLPTTNGHLGNAVAHA